ncbi:MAG: pyrroloquinoline quinone biosynthesis protein PqqE, partial [Methylococcales bacterium]
FRGDSWMKQPCRECPEKTKDFGGCRCQAYLLTGDMYAADPVCSKSPDHSIITKITDATEQTGFQSEPQPLVFRNPKNATKPNDQDSI